LETIKVRPTVTSEIFYLAADTEDRYTIAQANAELDDKKHFVQPRVSVRRNQKFLMRPADEVDYMDVAPRQIVGISAALIPFLEHDDANRALMDRTCSARRAAASAEVPLWRPGWNGRLRWTRARSSWPKRMVKSSA